MNSTNVLIVEDETLIALDIKKSVEKMGFNVLDYIATYDEVLVQLKQKIPDIILMDINLENPIDGIEIVERIKDYKIPVIYLTAYTDEETINRAIKTEPIGYIVKPFNREELKASILLGMYKLKEEKVSKPQLIKLGESYYFDKEHEQLFFNNIHIKLSKRERKLLVILIEGEGNFINFMDIEYQIWDDVVTKSALRTLIYRLRSKLDYKLIETKPAYGCKINIFK